RDDLRLGYPADRIPRVGGARQGGDRGRALIQLLVFVTAPAPGDGVPWEPVLHSLPGGTGQRQRPRLPLAGHHGPGPHPEPERRPSRIPAEPPQEERAQPRPVQPGREPGARAERDQHRDRRQAPVGVFPGAGGAVLGRPAEVRRDHRLRRPPREPTAALHPGGRVRRVGGGLPGVPGGAASPDGREDRGVLRPTLNAGRLTPPRPPPTPPSSRRSPRAAPGTTASPHRGAARAPRRPTRPTASGPSRGGSSSAGRPGPRWRKGRRRRTGRRGRRDRSPAPTG